MNTSFPLKVLAVLPMLLHGANVHALPVGGRLTSGSAVINGGSAGMAIIQSSANAVINWQSFNVGPNETVQFVQPNSNSIVLNRVVGSEASSILGSVSSNGKVFLINPNGILFGNGAQVNVGGLVAATLNITDGDFMAGNYKFSGTRNGAILNQGTISTNTDGSYVALLGTNVGNNGSIIAKLGTVALAAGTAITLDLAGDGLLNVTVNQGAINALIQNGGLIQADGGLVLLTTQIAGSLLQSVVNNTGVIQAQTIDSHTGTIKLLADMQNGTVNVGGTLSAQGGADSGDGGFIETSGSHVVIREGAYINTLAPQGKTGLWLLDPLNYTIAATGGDETPASVIASLASSNRTIAATNDITVSNTISIASPQTLTLNAGHDVLINASISAVPAGAGLSLIAGNNVNAAAALTVTGAGSTISLSALNDVLISSPITAVGAASPITIKAGLDVQVDAAITTIGAGSTISLNAARNINVSAALAATAAGSSVILVSGLASTGPGVSGGTVSLSPTASIASISTTIRFNPQTYANTSSEISAYLSKVTGILDAKAWVFTQGNNKIYDGTNAASLTFVGNPASGGNVTLNPGSATFNSQNAGTNKTVIFMNTSLGGVDSNLFALFATSGTTTANITPAPLSITAANATKPYGQTITLTGFSVNGLINGETIAQVIESSPGTAANASIAGSPYLITASLATGGTFDPSNYTIVYNSGLLAVTPVIAMSVASAPAPVVTAMFTEVQPEKQDELLSVAPADTGPVKPTQVTPNI